MAMEDVFSLEKNEYMAMDVFLLEKAIWLLEISYCILS